jgi:hypothetical protein
VFPVRYGLDFYILFRRYPVFKGLIILCGAPKGLTNLAYDYTVL